MKRITAVTILALFLCASIAESYRCALCASFCDGCAKECAATKDCGEEDSCQARSGCAARCARDLPRKKACSAERIERGSCVTQIHSDHSLVSTHGCKPTPTRSPGLRWQPRDGSSAAPPVVSFRGETPPGNDLSFSPSRDSRPSGAHVTISTSVVRC